MTAAPAGPSLPDRPPGRVARLLARRPPTGRERTWRPNGCDERAVLLWEYFTQASDEPLPLRRGRGLGWALDHIAIAVHDDELLVGEVGLEDVAATRPDDLARAWQYWSARAAEFEAEVDSRYAREAIACGLLCGGPGRDGHTIPDFGVLLTDGIGALHQRAGGPNGPAMRAALAGLTRYIERHAALARQTALSARGTDRATELTRIAEVCDHIAREAPRTLWEALQLLWFAHLGIKLDDGGIGHSFGRFDQYLHWFYARDLADGVLSREGAAELIALFWLKLNAEGDDIAHLSLGGRHPDGSDAANDLSLLCLQVDRWVSRKQPNLSTRIHAGTSSAYWREIALTLRAGAGHPAVFNDEVIIPGLMAHGIDEATACGHAQVGCVETYLPGLAAPWIDCYVNLAKCLEVALNRGRDPITGAQLGPDPVAAGGFADFAALYEAFEAQVEHVLRQALARRYAYDERVSRHAPVPLISALTPACLEHGLDAVEGAPYLLTGVYAVGLGTTVDSLAAIRTLVFDERELAMSDLLRALAADFAGYERPLALCRQAPKYGNDDERADSLAAQVVASFGRLVRECPTPSPRALHYGMVGSVISHTQMGARTGASANGRRAGESLSDGGSPSQGCNVRGATATLRSMARPDFRAVPGGAAMNLRLSPTDAAGEAGLQRLVALLRSYFELGGEQLQVSVVDADLLRQARQRPNDHRDLVVRVAGFTAYFVSLPEALQDEVVARATARLGPTGAEAR